MLLWGSGVKVPTYDVELYVGFFWHAWGELGGNRYCCVVLLSLSVAIDCFATFIFVLQ